MMTMKPIISSALFSIIALTVSPANAAITGTVDATITLTAGCIVNGQNFDNGTSGADFGVIDFGTHNTLFTEADSQILSGASAFTVQCSNGITPVLSFDAGQHDGDGSGAGLHAMAHATEAGQFVTYNLYSDSTRLAVIPVGGDVSLTNGGTLQTVNIYARAFGEAGLTPGVYNDVVTVVLEL
ncbi:Csu type fimbrial protein [Sphingopyxis sp. R3-92]|uniref:Csu type fimbrial protein n=1 Tax=Sphingopyxis sp. R3-92 TaxID=3158553 RepID=UPI003EE54C03